MKHLITIFPLITIFILGNLFTTQAQTNLNAGDIAFTGYHCGGNNDFSFLLLASVENGSTIRFTDNGWKSDNTFRTGEGILLAFFSTDVPCGTEVHANPASGSLTTSSGAVGTLSTVSGSFVLSTSGDQILAYQGTEAVPVFISATNFNGNNPWDSDASSSNTSAIPMGLQNGVNAVGHNEVDHGRYECFNPISGPLAILRPALNDTRNWTKSDMGNIIAVPSGCAYNISDCVPVSCNPPSASCQSVTLSVNAMGNLSVAASLIGTGSTAECGIQSETLSPQSFDCNDVGNTISVTYTITDINDASSSCMATVTVEDDIAPTAGCTNVTVQLDANGNGSTTAATVESGSTDNCGTVNTVSLVPNTFGCGDIGPNTVTLTINDGNGNTSTCTATATVEDNIAPTAGCTNVTVQLDANGNGSTTAAAVESGSTDNCGTVNTVSLVPNTFTCGDIGPNTVTLTVNDGNGNTATCTATATVEDNIPPVPVCKTTTVEIQPDGLYTLQEADVYDTNASTDNCSIDDVSFPATVYDCDDENLTFTVAVTVTDAGGNTASCNATITVVVGTALPNGWQTNSIGAVTVGNDYSFDPCTTPNPEDGFFTIGGSGNNAFPGTTDDAVAFASQSLCGNDITITAKIESVTPNGYGGLMIRETSDADSKQVAIFSNVSNSLRHETRYFAGANKVVQNFVKPSPIWLRLQRQGNWVFAFSSTNGVSFQYVHAVYIPLSNCIQIGLASFTYLPNTQTEATFSHVEITGGMMMSYVEAPEITAAVTIKQAPGLYPNPASDIVNLVFEDALSKDAIVTLRNQLGQVIEQRELQVGDFATEWNISALIDGLYFFEIWQDREELQVLKLVKTK